MDTETRVPLSITLRKDLLAFALQCAASREIGSLDAFFDTAVEVLRMHMDAMLRYVEAAESEEIPEEDTMRAADCGITRDH